MKTPLAGRLVLCYFESANLYKRAKYIHLHGSSWKKQFSPKGCETGTENSSNGWTATPQECTGPKAGSPRGACGASESAYRSHATNHFHSGACGSPESSTKRVIRTLPRGFTERHNPCPSEFDYFPLTQIEHS